MRLNLVPSWYLILIFENKKQLVSPRFDFPRRPQIHLSQQHLPFTLYTELVAPHYPSLPEYRIPVFALDYLLLSNKKHVLGVEDDTTLRRRVSQCQCCLGTL